MITIPKKAATVILLRDCKPKGLEVFLLKRHEKSWDPEYKFFERGEIPSSINHGRLSRSGDHTSRLILRQGIWHPFCRTR